MPEKKLMLGELGFWDTVALMILEKAPFWNKSGRLIVWATRRLQPIFDELVVAALDKTVSDEYDAEWLGRRLVITYWSKIADNKIEIEGIVESGLSLQGCCSGVFARFREVREFCLLPKQEGWIHLVR